MKFILCANNEILSDGTHMAAVGDGVYTQDIISVGASVIHEVPGLDYDTDQHFPNWRGGKYCQFWNVCGFVAIPTDAGDKWQAIAWRINDAMRAAIERQDLDSQAADCLYWADELEEDRDLYRWFGQHRLDLLLPNYDDDVDSLPKALRKRAAELKSMMK